MVQEIDGAGGGGVVRCPWRVAGHDQVPSSAAPARVAQLGGRGGCNIGVQLGGDPEPRVDSVTVLTVGGGTPCGAAAPSRPGSGGRRRACRCDHTVAGAERAGGDGARFSKEVMEDPAVGSLERATSLAPEERQDVGQPCIGMTLSMYIPI